MKQFFQVILAVLLGVLIVPVGEVSAQPPALPFYFSGSVTVDGSPAQNGLSVTSNLGGSSSTSNGQYALMIPATAGITGNPVSFSVAGLPAGSSTLGANGDVTVVFNLSVTTPVTQYTLTMASSTGGTTSPAAGTHTYNSGTVVPVTATPSAGYQFASWTGPVANAASASTTVTMDGNKSVTANFTAIVVTYNLTMASSTGGTTSPATGTHTYNSGTVVPVTATPSAGYQFASWTGPVANAASASTTVTMDGNKSVTANFTAIVVTYNLTMASSTGGTTSPAAGTHTYNSGTVVPVTATPSAGYQFASWTGPVANAASASTTVTMDGNKSVTANFTAIVVTYNLTMASSTGGTTSPAAGTHTYNSGTVVPVTATPSAGYQFASWTGPVANAASASTTVTMDGNKSVTANFTAIVVTYNLTMASSTGGTTSPAAGTHTYNSGTVVPVTATPSAGYQFASWTGPVANAASASTTVTMDGNKSVTANFTAIVVTYNLTMASSTGGTTSPAAGTHTYNSGTVVPVTATPSAGYQFASWTGPVANAASASTTVTMDGNKSVTANFTAIVVTYNLTMASSTGGTTSPATGTHTYNSGTVVPVTATPSAGYQFASWTGPVANAASASTTVTMDGNKSVTANFTAIVVTYNLTMASSTGGTTSPAAGTHTYNSGTVVPVTATPSAGYQFASWTGPVANAASASTTVTMDGNKSVTANFTAIVVTYNLTMASSTGGTTSPAAGTRTYNSGTVVPVTATPSAGYQFASWTGPVANAASASTTVTMDGNKSVTANFTAIVVTYNLTMASSTGGTTSPAAGTHTYNSGTVVPVTATPSAGYQFASWTGPVANAASASTTVTMDGNKSVTANFTAIVVTTVPPSADTDSILYPFIILSVLIGVALFALTMYQRKKRGY